MQGHAFVLHLTRATARRDNARALLGACGMDAEIWAAVDGAAMSAADLRTCVDAGIFVPCYPFALRTGEIGCFLSHRQIWAEIVRRELAFGLVIEDDAAIEQGLFGQALALALAHVETLGLIQFQTRPPRAPATLIETAGPCVLCVPRESGLRTTAQIVSRRAARHLLHLSARFDRPVDTFLQSHWHTGLRPAAIHPSGVMDVAGQLDGSTIQGGARPTLTARLGREWARFGYRRAVARASRTSRAPAQGGLAPEGAA